MGRRIVQPMLRKTARMNEPKQSLRTIFNEAVEIADAIYRSPQNAYTQKLLASIPRGYETATVAG